MNRARSAQPLLPVLLAVLLAAPAAGAAPARRGSGDNSVQRARALYTKGKAAYEAGAYADATEYFERSYQLTRAPALLFNMAQAHRLSGPEHCERALGLYQEYLRSEPRATNRDEAAERVGEMRACVEQREREQAEAAAREADEASAPPESAAQGSAPLGRAGRAGGRRVDRTPAILLTGAGAALTVAGVILYARSRAKYDEVKADCPCPDGAYSDWSTLTTVSYGLLASGAAATAGGVSWLVLGSDSSKPRVQGLYVRASLRF